MYALFGAVGGEVSRSQFDKILKLTEFRRELIPEEQPVMMLQILDMDADRARSGAAKLADQLHQVGASFFLLLDVRHTEDEGDTDLQFPEAWHNLLPGDPVYGPALGTASVNIAGLKYVLRELAGELTQQKRNKLMQELQQVVHEPSDVPPLRIKQAGKRKKSGNSE